MCVFSVKTSDGIKESDICGGGTGFCTNRRRAGECGSHPGSFAALPANVIIYPCINRNIARDGRVDTRPLSLRDLSLPSVIRILLENRFLLRPGLGNIVVRILETRRGSCMCGSRRNKDLSRLRSSRLPRAHGCARHPSAPCASELPFSALRLSPFTCGVGGSPISHDRVAWFEGQLRPPCLARALLVSGR